MSKVELEEDTIDAAGMAYRGVESGRRVGWAKAFEFMRRADSAEHDVNVLRSDVKILSSFAARAYGALEVTVSRGRMDELFRGDNGELVGFFPEGPLNNGRDAMRRLLAKKLDEYSDVRRRVKEAQDESKPILQAASDKMFAAAKRAVAEEWMARYGIPDAETLDAWMSQFQERRA